MTEEMEKSLEMLQLLQVLFLINILISGHFYTVNNSLDVDGDAAIYQWKRLLVTNVKGICEEGEALLTKIQQTMTHTEKTYGLPLNFLISRVFNIGPEVETRLFKSHEDFLEN